MRYSKSNADIYSIDELISIDEINFRRRAVYIANNATIDEQTRISELFDLRRNYHEEIFIDYVTASYLDNDFAWGVYETFTQRYIGSLILRIANGIEPPFKWTTSNHFTITNNVDPTVKEIVYENLKILSKRYNNVPLLKDQDFTKLVNHITYIFENNSLPNNIYSFTRSTSGISHEFYLYTIWNCWNELKSTRKQTQKLWHQYLAVAFSKWSDKLPAYLKKKFNEKPDNYLEIKKALR